MKKIVLLLFIAVLFSNIANAEIEITGFESEKYNLGDSIELEGYIRDIEGFATLEINSNCGNVSKMVHLSTVKDGDEFDVTVPAKESMLGGCNFKINLKDDETNVLETSDSESFSVTKELRVEGETNVLSQKPGEQVIVKGVIRKENGIRVESGSVALTLNNKVYASGLSNGAFSYTFNLPSDIGSGIRTVEIKARDLEGNEGRGNVEFKVLSVPEGLGIELDKDSYKPKDRVLATVYLNDQSGKNIEGSSTVQLEDPEGNEELSRVADNGNDFEIFLSSVALPGTWILEAQNNDLKIDKKFYVEEVKDKEVRLEGDKLSIINTGNVKFEDPIQIDLVNENGEEYTVIKKTSLKPNQTIVVDLKGEVPWGAYDVSVGGSLITGNVVVEGSSLGNLKNSVNIGYFALIFVFLFLIFVVISKGKKRLSRRQEARKKGKEILSQEAINKVIEKQKEKEGKKDEKEIKKSDIDFLVNKVKPKEESEEKKEDSSSKNNFFDIFN